MISSVSQALNGKGWRRIAVITPYNEDLTNTVAQAAAGEDREVVATHGMGITDDVALAGPTPTQIVKFAEEKLNCLSFDGLFVSCTNFRAYEALELLRDKLDVDVVWSYAANWVTV